MKFIKSLSLMFCRSGDALERNASKLLTFSGGKFGTRESHGMYVSQDFPDMSLQKWRKELALLKEEGYIVNVSDRCRGRRDAFVLTPKGVVALKTFLNVYKNKVPSLRKYLATLSFYKDQFKELEPQE